MNSKKALTAAVQEILFQYGLKGVTMDDLARQLGKSKKTFYKFYSSKEDLIKEVVLYRLSEDMNSVQQIMASKVNAIEQLLMTSKALRVYLKRVKPSIAYELKKYYPQLWSIIESFQKDFIFNMIKENLQQGKAEDFYRKDLEIDMLALLYLGHFESISSALQAESIQLDMGEFHKNMVDYHLRGICNDKGREFLNNYVDVD